MRLLGPPKPYFSMSLQPDFLTNSSIPKYFHEYLEEVNDDEGDGINSTKIAKLRDKIGRWWDVKVNFDSLCFGDGWENFCRDNDLQAGYFLVFRHQGNWVFHVLVFDHTAAEGEFFPMLNELRAKTKTMKSDSPIPPREPCSVAHDAKGNVEKMGDEGFPKTKSSFKPSGYPYFHTILKPYCFNCGSIFIPMKFGVQHGLIKRWCGLVLIDEAGKSWSLKLRHMNTSRPNGGNPYITGGCSAFIQAHGMKSGDHLVFELLDSGDEPKMKVYTCEQINCRFVDKAEEMIKAKKTGELISAKKKTGGKRKRASKQEKICGGTSEMASQIVGMDVFTPEGKHKRLSKQKKKCVDTSEIASMVTGMGVLTPEQRRVPAV